MSSVNWEISKIDSISSYSLISIIPLIIITSFILILTISVFYLTNPNIGIFHPVSFLVLMIILILVYLILLTIIIIYDNNPNTLNNFFLGFSNYTFSNLYYEAYNDTFSLIFTYKWLIFPHSKIKLVVDKYLIESSNISKLDQRVFEKSHSIRYINKVIQDAITQLINNPNKTKTIPDEIIVAIISYCRFNFPDKFSIIKNLNNVVPTHI